MVEYAYFTGWNWAEILWNWRVVCFEPNDLCNYNFGGEHWVPQGNGGADGIIQGSELNSFAQGPPQLPHPSSPVTTRLSWKSYVNEL